MKLNTFAKKFNVSYQTALNWYQAGQIPGAFSTPSGTIFIPDDVEERMRSIAEAKKVNKEQ